MSTTTNMVAAASGGIVSIITNSWAIYIAGILSGIIIREVLLRHGRKRQENKKD